MHDKKHVTVICMHVQKIFSNFSIGDPLSMCLAIYGLTVLTIMLSPYDSLIKIRGNSYPGILKGVHG